MLKRKLTFYEASIEESFIDSEFILIFQQMLRKGCSEVVKCEYEFSNETIYGLIRPLSVYSMGGESSDEMKLSPMRKKKLTFELYFIFSSDMLRKEYFFPKSVVFLPKTNHDFQKSPTRKTPEGFFLFFPLRQGTKTSVGIRRP